MNHYSRIFHHISISDVKKQHLKESAEKVLKEKRELEEKKYIAIEVEKGKSDWRSELTLTDS